MTAQRGDRHPAAGTINTNIHTGTSKVNSFSDLQCTMVIVIIRPQEQKISARKWIITFTMYN